MSLIQLVNYSNQQINGMKKYTSYIDLKLAGHQKTQNMKSPKHSGTAFKRTIALDNIIIPSIGPSTSKAKYSAAYLQQRKKIFSNKKENKNEGNARATHKDSVIDPLKQKQLNTERKTQEVRKMVDSKCRKAKEERKEKPMKFQKIEKNLEIQIKQKDLKNKVRMQIQSPKINFMKEERQKSKIKDRVMALKENKIKKKESQLKQYVTSYQMDKKILVQCTSEANLIKPTIFIENKQNLLDYYTHTIHTAFFSSKSSTFLQLARNHLLTSIEFLSFAKKNKKIVPAKVKPSSIPLSNRPTIVFDLDETLIHCNESLDMPHDVSLPIIFPNNTQIKAGINIRPYAEECIRQLSQHFELILFTASHQCYANVIVDFLDPHKMYFKHRLFRESCHKTEEGFYVKDLRVLNRNLESVLLVDNAAYSYCFQPENGIPIIPFYDNKADLELKSLTAHLKRLVGLKDLRNSNQKYFKLSEYHKFKNPKQLINQLYM